MAKFNRVKVFKLSIVYCRVAPRRQTNRQLSISINKAVIAYANMRDTRAHNFIRSVCKDMINQCGKSVTRVGSFINCERLYNPVISMSTLEL